MKVILTQVIPKLGKQGQVVNVADGFARNYLFPRKMALVATKGQLKVLELRNARMATKMAEAKSHAEAVKEKLNNQLIRIEGKIGKEGTKLFGAVTSQDIVDLVHQQFGVSLDKRQVGLLQPIKRLGQYKIQVDLHQEVDAFLLLDVYNPNAPQEVDAVIEDQPEEVPSES
jgi:large subunit ribosomal protein L9